MYDYTQPADATGLSDAFELQESGRSAPPATWVTMDVDEGERSCWTPPA